MIQTIEKKKGANKKNEYERTIKKEGERKDCLKPSVRYLYDRRLCDCYLKKEARGPV
jgi:hypothetical protein